MVSRELEVRMLLTVMDIANVLRVSRQCVCTLIDDGQLDHTRLPPGQRSIRVGVSDLIGFLQKNKVPKQSKSFVTRTTPAPTAFEHLNGVKLREAWAEKGISRHG